MKRSQLAILLFSALILLLGAFMGYRLATDPDNSILIAEAGARWIREDIPPSLFTQDRETQQVIFRRAFTTQSVPIRASLAVKAFRSYKVFVNRKPVALEVTNPAPWISSDRIDITSLIRAGANEVIIFVQNANGPPALMAYSDELDLATDSRWVTWSEAEPSPRPAVPLTQKAPAAISQEFPTSGRSLLAKLPHILMFFVLGLAVSLLLQRYGTHGSTPLRPSHVRWTMLGAWVVLCVNNIAKIPLLIGFDIPHHYDYIEFVGDNWSLPLATEGWQMFQSPLYYILSAGLYRIISMLMSMESTALALRVLPMLCGLAQIEIAFRASRIVFPRRNDLQLIGTVVGGLLPMNIYISQVVSNEPLAGCLTALMLYYCMKLMMAESPASPFKSSVLLGILLGLALLSKVTPILLLPVLLMVILYLGARHGLKPDRIALSALTFLLTTGVVAGWYFIRNWIYLGRPFVGGWDPAAGESWWQDPGYRIPQDLLSFGEALVRPIYASLAGFWDGLYSSFWLDAYLGSTVFMESVPPWNYDFMLSMVLLSIPMTIVLLLGIALALKWPVTRQLQVKLLCVCCLALYLAALVYHFLIIPNYSVVKSSYTLGLIPCYALLIASGFEPILRNRIARALVFGYLCAWSATGFLAYFVW